MNATRNIALALSILAGSGIAGTNAWDKLKQGIAAFRQQDFTRAARLLEAAERANARCFDAAYYLGRIHDAQGKDAAAAADYRRVPEGHSYFALAQDGLATILLRNGKKKEALECLRASAKARPAPAIWMRVATLEMELRQYEPAGKSLAEAAKLTKGDFRVIELRARLFAETDRGREALVEYDKLIARFGDDYRLHHLRALCLVKLDRKRAAARAFERVLKLNPNHKAAIAALIGLWENDAARATQVEDLELRLDTLRRSPPVVIRQSDLKSGKTRRPAASSRQK